MPFQRPPCATVGRSPPPDHEDAGDQHLVDRRDAHQRQAVAQHAHHHGADQRTEDHAAPAEQRLVPPSTTAVMASRFSVWLALGSPTPVRRHAQQRGDAVEHAGQHVHASSTRSVGMPTSARGLGVVAHRVDVAASGGLAQPEPGAEAAAIISTVPNATLVPPSAEGVAQPCHQRRHVGHGLRVRVQLRDREGDVEGAQRDDERRQL